MNLFQKVDFISHAGLPLSWKIECDALTEDDWKGLARMIMDHEPRSFGSVEGIPRGGIPLANALSEYATEGPPMIVDDVYTTGTSMREVYEDGALGIVVFARNKIHDDWVKAIWQLSI